jgi:ABC-type Mn2+/Zn2+ transport system permease subunit
VNSIPARFAVGWTNATLASVVSLFLTAKVDLPIGPAIVCVLGAVLVLVALAARLFRKRPQ